MQWEPTKDKSYVFDTKQDLTGIPAHIMFLDINPWKHSINVGDKKLKLWKKEFGEKLSIDQNNVTFCRQQIRRRTKGLVMCIYQ